jgi:PTS system nitrogen regulatory IIA component
MDIGDWLDRGGIAPRASAPNKRQALGIAADLAARSFGLDAAEVLDALMEREQGGSTGVGQGVAVPHARVRGLDRIRAVFVRLDTPIEFGAVDDVPVDLLFVLLGPEHDNSGHLRALARVSRLLRRGEVRERLRQARSADAIHALLVQAAEPNAA